MNNLRNRVQLIGNLGTTPEVIDLKEGRKLVKLTLATNDTYKNKKGETIKETQWHNLTVFGNLAEIAEQHLEKGKEVCILCDTPWPKISARKKISARFLDI